MRHVPLFCSAVLLSATGANAQLQQRLYGIDEWPSHAKYFGYVDLTTNELVDLQPAPISFWSSGYCSSVDVDRSLYYLCDGRNIHALDAYGQATVVTTVLPLAESADFIDAVYDPCTQSFYGIVNDPPESITFARFDPGTMQFTTLAQLPASSFFSAAPEAVIDPSGHRYYLLTPDGFLGFDLLTGQSVCNVPVTEVPGETFAHIAFECGAASVGRFIGTSASSGSEVKYLSTIDPATGIVSHLSDVGSTNGFLKPLAGGSCIDQGTNTFYWPGFAGEVLGDATSDGAMTYTASIAPNIFNMVEHFSQCACLGTGIATATGTTGISVGPNPCADLVHLALADGGTGELHLEILDLTGRTVHVLTRSATAGTDLDVRRLPPGTYVYRLCWVSPAGTVLSSGKLIKL